jgi:hypothetical protein
VGKNGVYGGNVEIIATSDIFKVSASIYFVSQGKISQPFTVIVGQVVTERNAAVMVSEL